LNSPTEFNRAKISRGKDDGKARNARKARKILMQDAGRLMLEEAQQEIRKV
jgi:hypothetical protein